MNELERFRVARERLSDPKMWSNDHGYGAAAGPNCIVGACLYADGRNKLPDGADFFLYEQLAATLGFERESIAYEWNDTPTRTHADVLRRLDTAIARLEEQSSGAPLPPLTTTLHHSEPSKAVV